MDKDGFRPMESVQIEISGVAGASVARQAARRLTGSLAFAPAEAEQIVLAISELATNLWLHAGGGTLSLEPLLTPRAGLRILSLDRGPGIADIPSALRDGVSTRGGLGSGLAAVNRLLDEVRIQNRPEGGLRIEGVKWRS